MPQLRPGTATFFFLLKKKKRCNCLKQWRMAQVRLCDFQSYVWKHLCGILYFPNIAQYILSYKLFLLSDTWVKTASTKGVRYNDVIWFLRLDNNCLHFHLLWDTLLELKSQVRQPHRDITCRYCGQLSCGPAESQNQMPGMWASESFGDSSL